MSKNNSEEGQNCRPTPKPVLIITPVLVFLICTALTAVIGIVPYNKMTTYLKIAFSDKLKSTSVAADNISADSPIINFDKDRSENVSKEGEVVYPKFGEQYATLSCDTIKLYVPVYWGSDDKLLENGACQHSSSVVIGKTGNVVIDAHVNTFFADLDKLKEGDLVVLNTSYGEFKYKVTKQITFAKTDKTYVLPSDTDKLTLYTCVKQVLGSSDQRIGVVCEPVDKAFYN